MEELPLIAGADDRHPLDALFINAPLRDYTLRPRTNDYTLPVLGMAYIATYARRRGFNVGVLDAEAHGLGAEATARIVNEAAPRWAALNLLAPTYEIAAQIAARLDPGIALMAGGHHAKAMPDRVLADPRMRHLRALVLGEGELRVAALLEDEQNRRTLPGVLWRDPLLGTRAAGIADPRTGAALLGPDIDSLPYVDRAFLPQDPYRAAPTATDLRLAGERPWLGGIGAQGHWEANIVGSRGCPYNWTPQHVEHWQRTGERPSPVMVWTPEQLGVFLDEAESSRLYALYHLIAFRGLRRGEGVGQDWRHVDLDAGLITPAKTLMVDSGEVFEDDPKAEESSSTIALDSLSVAVLREHRQRQLAERDEWNRYAAEQREQGKKVADRVDTGKVCTDLDGTWLHPERASEEFRRIVRRVGLPPISLRDLRHLAATLVHAGGGDIHAVKKVLRHSTIALTSDTYPELLEDVDRGIAEKAARMVPRALRRVDSEPAAPVDDAQDFESGEAA